MTMDLDTYPNPQQPNPHHRKIDLQSSHDLTYLQTNLANSALQKLDLHFPKISQPATHIALGGGAGAGAGVKETQPKQGKNGALDGIRSGEKNGAIENEDEEAEEEEDPMRRRVHDLVTAFLTGTWQSAAHSISVNGIDASSIPLPHTATLSKPPLPANPPPPTNGTDHPASVLPSSAERAIPQEVEGVNFQYAAFDASLQRKLASLHGEVEALTAQVSRLRRSAPQEGAERYQARLEEAMRADDVAHDEPDVTEGEEVGMEIDGVRGGWKEDVEEMYDHGIRELAGLAGVGTAAQREEGHSRGRASGNVDESGLNAGNGTRGPTLTETVGKAQRAIRVAMELE